MNSTEKDKLNKETTNRRLFLRFRMGCEALCKGKGRVLVLFGYLALAALLWLCRGQIFRIDSMGPFAPVVSGVLLLMECVKKGAVVCIADFKGGVDFPMVWHRECRMCFEERELPELLTGLVDELERRKTVFRGARCPNIDDYNKAMGDDLQRLLFACDEVAEVLDKTGLNKEQKELVSQIESKLSVIARQGPRLWGTFDSCHAKAGCNHSRGADTQQHRLPGVRQGG